MFDNRVDNLEKITAYTLELPSKIESLILVENLIDTLNDQYDLPDDIYANILTCLSEAVNNAVVHGNKERPDKVISMEFTADASNLMFKVRDQGSGFDYNDLADPTDPENIEKLTGRGIFIVRKLADKCRFNKMGNEIELYFTI